VLQPGTIGRRHSRDRQLRLTAPARRRRRTDAVAVLGAPGHPANGLVVRGDTVADTHERVLALLMSLRTTGAFFAPRPSRLN
jgi:hypothetical protein